MTSKTNIRELKQPRRKSHSKITDFLLEAMEEARRDRCESVCVVLVKKGGGRFWTGNKREPNASRDRLVGATDYAKNDIIHDWMKLNGDL